jgi:hypothetical protein
LEAKARQAAERKEAAERRLKEAASAADRKRLESEAAAARRDADQMDRAVALAIEAERQLKGVEPATRPTATLSAKPDGSLPAETRAKEALALLERSPYPFESKPKTAAERKFEEVAKTVPAMNTAIDAALEVMERERKEAIRLLSYSPTLREYGITFKRVETVLKGTQHFFSATEYGLILKEIAASVGTKRESHIGDFIWKATNDLVSTGVEQYVTRMLGKEAARTALHSATTVLTIPAIVLDPEPIAREPAEVIRDERTSLREKQNAVGRLWEQYDNQRIVWGVGQKLELAELSGIVYEKAILEESRATPPVTNPRRP